MAPARNRFMRLTLSGLALAAVVLSGCASNGDPRDPLEPLNRKVYSFNSTLDEAILAPTARAYKDYVPYVFRYSFSSFMSNIDDVWIGANNLLQGQPGQAVHDWTRVLLNTTFGFFGLSDPASEMGFPKQREDFGQTLGVWGLPTGPYIVLPLFGPSSVRGTTGLVVDSVVDPLDQVIFDDGTRLGATALGVVDFRAGLLGASNILKGAALDEYSFVRDGYLQRRRNMVYDGDPPFDDEDDEPLPTYSDD
ncbi:MAG: VacJ family lipoprotein [Burkholderiaceae bacterium]